MDYAISKILEKVPVRVICLTKYVDDIFCLVPHDKVTDTLALFNEYHPKLQFTVEVEREGGLPYLDTFVIRKPANLETMWYKKPIASDRMLNFHSQHPLRQKIGTAIGLINRVDKLTTNNKEQVKDIVFSKLRVNGFPPKLINVLWNRQIGRQVAHNTSQNMQANTEVMYKSITYIPKLSDAIKRILCAETQTIKLAFKCTHTNSTIYNTLILNSHLEK
uniref:Helix-turn-helix domain-containing protein n=1 Tax=Phlebotomus papatasi TaxID=29031 RepID=A0A1B0D7A5_PHLPP